VKRRAARTCYIASVPRLALLVLLGLLGVALGCSRDEPRAGAARPGAGSSALTVVTLMP
jgi:hypothetical protein